MKKLKATMAAMIICFVCLFSNVSEASAYCYWYDYIPMDGQYCSTPICSNSGPTVWKHVFDIYKCTNNEPGFSIEGYRDFGCCY